MSAMKAYDERPQLCRHGKVAECPYCKEHL
jgi:hypothetical protein